jgi:hypothetical protein
VVSSVVGWDGGGPVGWGGVGGILVLCLPPPSLVGVRWINFLWREAGGVVLVSVSGRRLARPIVCLRGWGGGGSLPRVGVSYGGLCGLTIYEVGELFRGPLSGPDFPCGGECLVGLARSPAGTRGRGGVRRLGGVIVEVGLVVADYVFRLHLVLGVGWVSVSLGPEDADFGHWEGVDILRLGVLGVGVCVVGFEWGSIGCGGPFRVGVVR